MKESTKSNILMYVLGLISIVGAAFGAIQYFKNSDNPQVLLENRVASLERSDTQQGEDIKEMKLHNAQIDRRLDKIDMNLDYLVLNFKSITEMRVKNQRD